MQRDDATTASGTASLDAVEITEYPPTPVIPLESSNLPAEFQEPFRHSGWRRQRNLTLEALELLRVSRSRIARFKACGSRCWLLKKNDAAEDVILAVEHCHDRFCIPCARARSNRLAMNLLKLCEGKDLRFFTFTLKHSHTPLKQQLDRLTKCWRKMRSTRAWKTTQQGGVGVIEIKRSKSTDCWHPHLHVIAEGKFLSQSEAAGEWRKITGDSYIVDVRRLRDSREACRYISKYASKGIELSASCDVQQLAEAIGALGSKRLVQCFGTWSNLKTTDSPSSESWSRWMTLEELLLQCNAGVNASKQILQQLRDDPRWTRILDEHAFPTPPPPPSPTLSTEPRS